MQKINTLIDGLQNEISLIMTDHSKTAKYQQKQKKDQSTIHWGQRKLLLSEVWFLCEFGQLSKNVVYAGAAPGTHIHFLAQMFPNHIFYLIDPSPFRLRDDIPVQGRVHVRQEYFTNKIAQEYYDKFKGDCFLMSDIRTAEWKLPEGHTQQERLDKNEEVEKMVIRDNKWQQEWCQIMKPKKALLKFRCPYSDRKIAQEPFEYMHGIVFIQQWAPISSSESRLVPQDYFKTVKYDIQKYEDQFFYHNQFVRQNNTIESQTVKGEGLTQNWDSAAEVLILAQYFEQYRHLYQSNLSYKANIALLSKTISRAIVIKGGRRTLLSKPKQHQSFDFGYRKHEDKVGIQDIL